MKGKSVRNHRLCSRGALSSRRKPVAPDHVGGTSPSAPKRPRRSNSDIANACAAQHDNAVHQRVNQERRATASGMGEVSQEVVGLLRSSASSLACKDNQARATKLARQLGVSALLGAACLVQSSPVSGGTLSPWGSIGSDKTDQSRVDRQLCTVEERQTICDHFEATVIQLASWQDVKVLDTLAPASLQMRAAQLSKRNPRRPSTPDVAHAARGGGHGSQVAGHTGRRRTRGGAGTRGGARKGCENIAGPTRDAGDVREQWNGIQAMGPCCERASACSVGPNLGHTMREILGNSSSGWNPGRCPRARSPHSVASTPAATRRSLHSLAASK